LRQHGHRVAGERQPAGQQLVEDHAQAVHVAGRAHRLHLAGDLLGRHVGRRPQDGPFLRHPRVPAARAPGQAEVHDDRLAAPVDHDVGRLEVAVDHAPLVRLLQRQGQLAHQEGTLSRRRRLGADELPQRLALEEGHGQVGDAVDLAGVVERADVGVLDQRRRLGLAVEAGQDLRPLVRIELRDLEGDRPVELGVVRQVNGAHTALAEEFEEPVAAEPGRELTGELTGALVHGPTSAERAGTTRGGSGRAASG
jgi:hypothetical protein